MDNTLSVTPLDIYHAMTPNYYTGIQPSQTQTTPIALHQEQPQNTGCRLSEWQARIVYLIQEHGDTPMTKIGVTKSDHSLDRRLSNLQQGNGRPLSISYTYRFSEDGEAYALEQSLLKALAVHRTYPESEWVRLTPAQIVYFHRTGALPE